jgi:hypothetical protein
MLIGSGIGVAVGIWVPVGARLGTGVSVAVPVEAEIVTPGNGRAAGAAGLQPASITKKSNAKLSRFITIKGTFHQDIGAII